jgi:hypothetical protein
MAEVFEPIRILASLRSHGVSYVLVGGLGAAVHGASVDTDDVDICLPGDTENLARLSLALQQLVAEQRPPASDTDHQVSFGTPFGRLDIFESDEEFAALNANATDVNVGRGVVTRVASLDDLARLKRGSADLQGAVRLAALAVAPEGSAREGSAPELVLPMDADPEPNGRIDRILRKLADVDTYLTEVNNGQRPLRRKKA